MIPQIILSSTGISISRSRNKQSEERIWLQNLIVISRAFFKLQRTLKVDNCDSSNHEGEWVDEPSLNFTTTRQIDR